MQTNQKYLKHQLTGITHKFVVKNFCSDRHNISVLLMIDNDEVTFIIEKGQIGYIFPGDLINLSNERSKRTRHFIELVDDFYNDVPVDLPADLTYFDD
jgi:hypothetical protein